MDNKRLKTRLCLILLTGWLTAPTAIGAHHLTVGDVLAILNRDDVKERTGIREAKVDPNLKRHLIIKVSETWYNLPAQRREKLAATWLQLWKDAMKNGIVSVLDAVSNEPVVNYSPSGSVSLTRQLR